MRHRGAATSVRRPPSLSPQVAADETNHRDVNHTFASMARDDPNPYVSKHMKDAAEAHRYWQQLSTPLDGRGRDFLNNPEAAPSPDDTSEADDAEDAEGPRKLGLQ